MYAYEDLIERLKRLDEDASLTLQDDNTYECVIVGGGALILMGFISRATQDIDVIHFTPAELLRLMSKYDINANVSAHLDCFPEDYYKRAKQIEIPTQKIVFYTLSLEDLVISKLNSYRDKDIKDISEPRVLKDLNWNTLDQLAQEMEESLISERLRSEFKHNYTEYVRRYRQ